MIEKDKDRFRAVMLQMAVDKRYQDQLDRATLLIMFEAMKGHCTIEDLERVAPELMREKRFFPRVDEWLDAIAKLPPPTVLGLLPPIGTNPQTGKPRYCEKCNDEGWVLTNDTNPASVVKCDCRDKNPALGAGQRRQHRRSDE